MARACALGASIALVAASGCYAGTASTVSPQKIAAEPGWLVVPRVALVRQAGSSDCGAAALAMVLDYWQRPMSVDAIDARDPEAARHGWKAGALRDIARERGLQSFVVNGGFDDLDHELRQGRPVVVGVIKRYGDKPLAHYEVVIGIHHEKRRILTLDPADGWREDSLEGFAREWAPTERVTLVVLPPAQRSPGAS